MGTTTRQRAWRAIREAKRVLQNALSAGFLDIGNGADMRVRCDEVLAGQYPCTTVVTDTATWNGIALRTIELEGWYDTPAGLRVMLKRIRVSQRPLAVTW